jgi:hypothetical protein
VRVSVRVRVRVRAQEFLSFTVFPFSPFLLHAFVLCELNMYFNAAQHWML